MKARVAALLFLSGVVLIAQTSSPGPLTFQRIRNSKAEPQNWPTYWGDYQGTHYSSLKQINTTNAAKLTTAWTFQLAERGTLQATPVVVDGVMYTTGAPGTVFAVDARSGKQIWNYTRAQKVVNPFQSNAHSRGIALLGNRVYVGTLDAALVALDAKTGMPLWEVQVADTMLGYTITGAPLAVKDKIIVGIAGGEFGIRGFLDAYDAATGKRVWRFDTIPGPGQFGNDTWKGDSWKQGGGPTWLTGTYDPDLDLVYWPIGNPGPDIDGSVRAGDNLFTDSVVALDLATGQRKWHYQFTPGDTHDWDSTEDMILVDRQFRGQNRKLLLHADRNGIFYVLDRTNGKFLSGTAFVRQTWNAGFDENGRPKIVPGSESSPDGSIPVYPSLSGGTNFQAPSYDPVMGWFFLEYMEAGQRYFRVPAPYEAGKQYQGGRQARLDEPTSAGIRAINPETGKTEWDVKIPRGSLNNGLLSTAGGIVVAATSDGNLAALDSKTGDSLWRFQTGKGMAASPMSYSVDGKQYIAITGGNMVYSFALPE
jgi:alcohol dehydrogenase (cytochrome c)